MFKDFYVEVVKIILNIKILTSKGATKTQTGPYGIALGQADINSNSFILDSTKILGSLTSLMIVSLPPSLLASVPNTM